MSRAGGEPARGPLTRGYLAAALLLLLAFVARSAWSGSAMAPTYDEPYHLAAGLYYLGTGDARMGTSTLPGVLAALPWAGRLTLPTPPPEFWRTPDPFALGGYLLFGQGLDSDRILASSRAVMRTLATLTGLGLFLWATRLWGPQGGLVTLAAWSFCPTMIALSSLVTTETTFTAALLATLASLSWLLRRPGPGSALVHGLWLGAALLAKATALMYFPLAVGALAWRRQARPLLAILGAWLVAWLTIWAYHGFHFAHWTEPPPEFFLDQRLAQAGFWRLPGHFLWTYHLLPAPLLAGWTDAFSTMSRVAFLGGHWSRQGWWYFFPALLTMKLPVGTLGLLVLTLVTGVWRRVPLVAAAFVIYWLAAMAGSLNIGFRHVAPTLPWLFLLAGGLATCSQRIRYATGVCLALMALESLAVAPADLAFVNRLWGGPQNGYRLLTDSSFDWGQDLRLASARLAKENGPAWLGYFGTAWPSSFGVKAPLLPAQELHGGLYLVSATALQLPYLTQETWAGPWTPELQKRYSETGDPGLKFAKLCAGLRERAPDERIGWTILGYRLSDADVLNLTRP